MGADREAESLKERGDDSPGLSRAQGGRHRVGRSPVEHSDPRFVFFFQSFDQIVDESLIDCRRLPMCEFIASLLDVL